MVRSRVSPLGSWSTRTPVLFRNVDQSALRRFVTACTPQPFSQVQLKLDVLYILFFSLTKYHASDLQEFLLLKLSPALPKHSNTNLRPRYVSRGLIVPISASKGSKYPLRTCVLEARIKIPYTSKPLSYICLMFV